jgi:hypothetical protein
MNSFGNFLWKIFSVTMVFLCHIGSNCAIAEDVTEESTPTPLSDVASIAKDPKMTTKYFTSTTEVNENNGYKRTIQLCKSGYYLSSCGLSTIGTNWLKGLKKPGNVQTPNYYSYNTQESDTINMENLKKMFAHKETLTYTSRTSSNSNYVYATATALPSEYTPYLHQLLSNFCTNDEGKISDSDIACLPCPNNAYVERSTVEEDVYDTGKILWDSWNVHTIADCYMNEFSDENGTYVYVGDTSQPNSSKTNCYYTKNVYGTSLYYN